MRKRKSTPPRCSRRCAAHEERRGAARRRSYAYWVGALLAPDVLDSFWKGGARVIIAGTTDPVGRADRVAGGHRLSGRWRFGSGSPHATHFASGALVFDAGKLVRRENGSPLFRVFVTPASAVSIDTASWDALGLRGTSSHDYAIDDAFVPEGRHFQPAFDTSWRAEAQYR